MFEKTGIASPEMVLEKFPPLSRIDKGRVAVLECYRRIPCNPCETACPLGAIEIGEDINNMPVLHADKCSGCGMCLSRCPGLAIMIVDGSAAEEYVEITLPYEFRPLPEKGDTVPALSRSGKFVCEASVMSVLNPKSYDRTPAVRVRVPRKHLYDVRNIALKGKEG